MSSTAPSERDDFHQPHVKHYQPYTHLHPTHRIPAHMMHTQFSHPLIHAAAHHSTVRTAASLAPLSENSCHTPGASKQEGSRRNSTGNEQNTSTQKLASLFSSSTIGHVNRCDSSLDDDTLSTDDDLLHPPHRRMHSFPSHLPLEFPHTRPLVAHPAIHAAALTHSTLTRCSRTNSADSIEDEETARSRIHAIAAIKNTPPIIVQPQSPDALQTEPTISSTQSGNQSTTSTSVNNIPEVAASLVPSVPSVPVHSSPDLSSYSSANFDESGSDRTLLSNDDDDDDDEGGMDALKSSLVNGGGGAASLIPDLLSRGLSRLGGGGRNNTAAADSNHFSSDAMNDTSPPSALSSSPPRNLKLLHFERVLTRDEQVDLPLLRQMSWNGIPPQWRAISWKLLLGYLPIQLSRREMILKKRRREYEEYLKEFYYVGTNPMDVIHTTDTAASSSSSSSSSSVYDENAVFRTENEHDILKQIRQDVPRTSPSLPFFKHQLVQLSLERILYVFAVRHTASGYVQGMNDIVTAFYAVFLLELFGIDLFTLDTSTPDFPLPLSRADFLSLEADCFWCLSHLLDSIQDHYTFAQPGIQRMVYRLKELVLRIDGDGGVGAKKGAEKHNSTSTNASGGATTSPATQIGLHAHFEREHVEFLHFSFRWFSCLLLRELKLPLILRLWDSYLSEEGLQGFKVLHVYVCAAFLMQWKQQLKNMDFQQIIQFLLKPPTENWTERDVEGLLAQAHVYKTLFHSSPHHLL